MESTIREADLIKHEKIGKGSSAKVFRATWTSPEGNIQVAAKEIEIEHAEEIQLEVDILKTLDHENVIKYYGHFVTEEHVTIVTEYAAGGSLYAYLARLRKENKYPSLHDVQQWSIQAAKAIKYLQEMGVVHRDVKSPNLLIAADGKLKLCDFGIAKQMGDGTVTTLTAAKGTIRWQAPEVFMKRKVSPKADIFALGVVVWEMITGMFPWEDLYESEIVSIVGHENKRLQIPAECPEEIKQLLERCWDQNRDNRPVIEEALGILENWSCKALEVDDAPDGGMDIPDDRRQVQTGLAEQNTDRSMDIPDDRKQFSTGFAVQDADGGIDKPDDGLQALTGSEEQNTGGSMDIPDDRRQVPTGLAVQDAEGIKQMLQPMRPVPPMTQPPEIQQFPFGFGGAIQHLQPMRQQPIIGLQQQPVSQPVTQPPAMTQTPSVLTKPAGVNLDNRLEGFESEHALDIKCKTLTAAMDHLCHHLDPQKILLNLRSAPLGSDFVINATDKERIDHAVTTSGKVEKMLDVLRLKPMAAYYRFMEALYKLRPDLYQYVMEIETKSISDWKGGRNVQHTGQKAANIPTHQNRRPDIGLSPMTEGDLQTVIDELGPDDLQHFYIALGMRAQEVKKQEVNANTHNVDLKAKAVLRLWQDQKGVRADKEAVLAALYKCHNIRTREQLARTWNIRL